MSKQAPAKLNGVEGYGFIKITGNVKPLQAEGVFLAEDEETALPITLREAEFEGVVCYGDLIVRRSLIVNTRIFSQDPISYELTLKEGTQDSDIGIVILED